MPDAALVVNQWVFGQLRTLSPHTWWYRPFHPTPFSSNSHATPYPGRNVLHGHRRSHHHHHHYQHLALCNVEFHRAAINQRHINRRKNLTSRSQTVETDCSALQRTALVASCLSQVTNYNVNHQQAASNVATWTYRRLLVQQPRGKSMTVPMSVCCDQWTLNRTIAFRWSVAKRAKGIYTCVCCS